MFVDFRTELVEGSSKRACTKLEQEVTKKQKVDDVQETAKVENDQEAAKIKKLMKIVSGKEEIAIDVIPLAVKPPSIVHWKIHKEGKKSYYQIIRADRKSQMYLVFSHMLKSFVREDLETLWKLKIQYGGINKITECWNGSYIDHVKNPSSVWKYPPVTAALIDVNAAQSKLVLLEEFQMKYIQSVFFKLSTKLLLLEEVTTASGS
ncbi:hypothetical protein Tco_0859391 [Tanacetum coccineum]|uniref:Uncharacterized protein n=1 Tax=Tanacetum coccineum TaxID=301880 RepID=A0ABQ5BDL2_9ASTR